MLGIALTAFCSHAIGHWLAGRLTGLRFASIGVRGTGHPETHPPVMAQVLSAVPMLTTVSTRRSREAAGRWALAAYFAAGQTTAITGWVGSAVLARTLNIPGPDQQASQTLPSRDGLRAGIADMCAMNDMLYRQTSSTESAFGLL